MVLLLFHDTSVSCFPRVVLSFPVIEGIHIRRSKTTAGAPTQGPTGVQLSRREGEWEEPVWGRGAPATSIDSSYRHTSDRQQTPVEKYTNLLQQLN